MLKLIQKFTILALLCLASHTIFAETTSKGKELILNLMGNGAIVVEEFDSLGNLKGYVVKKDAQSSPFIVYADKDGEYIVDGTIYDKNKKDISVNDKQLYIFAKSAPIAMSNIKKTGHIIQTKKDAPIKHALTIVFEPNCSACHMLYKSLKPYIQSGEVSVRWVMVVFLKPTSEGRAATILQSADPVSSLEKNENNFNSDKEEGGADVATTVHPETKTKLSASKDFMQAIGFNGTPAIVYYDKAGKLQIVEGVPQNEALGDVIKNASNKFD